MFTIYLSVSNVLHTRAAAAVAVVVCSVFYAITDFVL